MYHQKRSKEKIFKIFAILFIKCAMVNNLFSQYSFDIEKAQTQALELFKKFNINNVSFAVKKDVATKTAAVEIRIDGKGIHRSIVFNQKLWKKLNESEREVVLCHEISHLKRGHIFLMPIASLLRIIIASFTPLIMMHQLDKRSYSYFSTFPSKILGALTFTAIINHINLAIEAKICRIMEYQADRDALKMTRDIQSSISALQKRGSETMNFWQSLFADHPSVDDRIKRLIQLSSTKD